MMAGASLTLGALADHLHLDCRGDRERAVTGLATLTSAGPDHLSFLANPRYRRFLAETRAGAVILAPALIDDCPVDCLVADDPYLAYARASRLFDRAPAPAPGIAAGATVAASACLASGVAVAAGAVVGERAVVGAGSRIGSNSVIGEGVKLGEHVVIHANATLYHGVTVGAGTVIHSGAVIGSDGFGYAPGPHGWEKIAQLGGVRIGSNVEIGANSTIDRGALEDTVIADGVIIDNLVQIAHNVRIGEGTAIAGCVGIAGSATIGAHCTIAGGAGIVGHIELADGVHVSAMALVSRSLTKRGSYSSGTGTMATGPWRKSAVRFTQLDELARRIAALEKQIHGDPPPEQEVRDK